MNRIKITLAALLLASTLEPAIAQFGGDPGAMADRFFGMLDRNRDGRIDEDEVRRIPGPMRDAMQNMGADLRRGISRDKFGEMLPRAMEEMRRGRESGGGFGGPPGRGGPPGYGDRGRGDGDRGDGRGPGDYRGRDDDRSRDSRYGPSSRGDSRGRSSRSVPKPPPRVTIDLPESWKAADFNGDGQIGLYEWDRKKFKEFFALDTNRDGLLTPREISRASGASAAPNPNAASIASSSAAAATSSRPASPSKSAAPAPSAPSSAPLTAVEYDAQSAEGRWAKYVFGKLDKNKDASLTEDEWSASARTRDSFKKYNAQLSLPATFESFASLMVAVERAKKKK
jgi:hypothetical protein